MRPVPSGGRRARLASWALTLALGLTPALPAPGAAEIRRLEAVGAAPVEGAATRANPRDAAILEAQREAVLRLASELLIDTAGEVSPQDLEAALGDDAAAYTTRFRIVDDRGERDALFEGDGDVPTEYVMVVEVYVDAERVRQRLRETGLLFEGREPAAARSVVLEVRGLGAYGAYEALRAALLDGAGARAVQPIEWTRGRGLLRVESEQSAQDLLDRLLGNLPGGLEVSPHRVREDRIQLRVDWTPPPEAHDGEPGEGPYPASRAGRAGPPPVEARPGPGRN